MWINLILLTIYAFNRRTFFYLRLLTTFLFLVGILIHNSFDNVIANFYWNSNDEYTW